MANILLVDDYAPTQHMLRFVLEQQGYTVITAFDGQQALDQLAIYPIDVIITDLTMPVMDGLALSHEVRRNSSYRNIPIICVTANGSEANPTKAAEVGINVFLTKPIASMDLLQKVSELIEHRIELKLLHSRSISHRE